MRRWLRALLAAVAAIAALLTPPAPAADALAPARGSFAYTYDGQQHSTNLTKIQTERGPPTHADTRSKGREAVDVLSRGDSACTDNLRACTATAYDDPAVFARGAVATTTANGQVEVTNAGACSVQRAGVAAKAVPEAVEAGGGAARAPSFIVKPNGETVIVPEGASGPFPTRGDGFQFTGGAGGHGLDSSVSSVRIMDPVTTGKYTYPNGYASYSNGAGQTVNPFTGQTVGRSSEWWHWAFGQ